MSYGVTIDFLNPELTIQGANQQLINTQVAASLQLWSKFVPTGMLSPSYDLDFRNNTQSGFRLRQVTTNTDTTGSLTLENFVANGTTGTTFWSISNAGVFTFNVPVILASKPYASLKMAANATATTVTTAGTYYKVAGTTTLSTSNLFTMPSNNRLTIGATADCQLNITGSFVDSGAGVTYDTFTIFKNGSISTDIAPSSINPGVSKSDFSLCAIISLASTDYVELFVTSSVNGTTVTVENLNFVLNGL